MRNQSVRLTLYASTAIVLLTLVWGFKSIPKQAILAESAVRGSIEQEMLVLSSAVKSSTQALRYRLLDVLKAEGNDHSTRAFQNSPFIAVTLFEWDQAQWKSLWHSSKTKIQFSVTDVKGWMADWPMSKLGVDEVYFTKVGDWQGQPYYAMLAPVRKPNNVPMIGVGIFPANQFGLVLSSDRTREVRVFDNKGYALALAHPAYVGSSVKREVLVDEALNTDDAFVRHEWKPGKGPSMFGLAARLPGTNLFASIEASIEPAVPYKLNGWLYLILAAAGAGLLNWYLFFTYNRPLLVSMDEQEKAIAALKKQITEGAFAPAAKPRAVDDLEDDGKPKDGPLPSAPLENMNFIEDVPAPNVLRSHTLQKVVQAALRSLEPKMKEHGIRFAEKGLQNIPVTADVLQLQTAIEEVMKNGIEAMQFSDERWLTISGMITENRVVLTIEDTGIGIAKENLAKVFDPFFSTKDSEGVARGLGLNVARRVIEEMKGFMRVESTGNTRTGTTVVMEWPLEEISLETHESPKENVVGEESKVAETKATDKQVGQSKVAEPLSIEDEIKADLAGQVKPNEVVLDDLELLAQEYEIAKPLSRDWPDVPIRKPIVRNLD